MEEDLQLTDPEKRMEATAADMDRQMEASAEAAKFSEKEMREAAEEAEVKTASAKDTAFLFFLVRVCTNRFAMF